MTVYGKQPVKVPTRLTRQAAKRDRLYDEANKAAEKLKGEFLHEGHALAGLTPIWVVHLSLRDCAAVALKMASDFGCKVVAEMNPMTFPETDNVWLRVWVDKEFAPAIKAFYRVGKRP